jgi:cytochrome P450
LLLFAGNETTQHSIGNGLLALLQHPGEWEELTRDPGRVGDAVEEALRYDSPVQGVSRLATQDVTLHGQSITRGDEVLVLLGAANRDPARFPDPDRLVLGRVNRQHLAFGAGVHFCLGATLARLEAQIAFETLARRLPQLRLAIDQPRWRGNSLVSRGLRSLPVIF